MKQPSYNLYRRQARCCGLVYVIRQVGRVPNGSHLRCERCGQPLRFTKISFADYVFTMSCPLVRYLETAVRGGQ